MFSLREFNLVVTEREVHGLSHCLLSWEFVYIAIKMSRSMAFHITALVLHFIPAN